jgi:hypothetical protein
VTPTALRIRVERLEASQAGTETPNLILSSCPMPHDPPTAAAIEGWLADGLAHVAFRGRAILYDGGAPDPLDEQQWRHRYCEGLPS